MHTSSNFKTDYYLFCDTETTGLDPDKDVILQCAGIITDAAFKVQSVFMTYVKPSESQQINEKAYEAHKLDHEKLRMAASPQAALEAFNAFALSMGGPITFAGYNCLFDVKFIDKWCTMHGIICTPYLVPWLDILRIARRELALADNKLSSVADHLGCAVDGAHDALADLYMTVKVARALAHTGTYKRFRQGGDVQIMKRASACKYCGAQIVWMVTHNDKKIPVDAYTVEPGDEVFDRKIHVAHQETCTERKY